MISEVISGNLVDALPDDGDAGYSSVVVEYAVPKHKSWSFRRWHVDLVRTARRAKGFVRSDVCRPLNCQDGALKWYTVIHFDCPENLSNWLSSAPRNSVLAEGKSIFETYRYKSFATGLEGWFSARSGEVASLDPPAWKQILSVVLGLYPVVMIQDYVFESLDILDDWPAAGAMWFNIMVTSCILTFVVMPLIVKGLDFWLQPAHRATSVRAEVVGTVVTLTVMAVTVGVFSVLGALA